MEWANFEHHGESPNAAFEALAGMLFERSCRRAYGARLREVRFVRGAGGDGGVEAYTVLTSGDVVGLQAKWFRDAFGATQIRQIDDSFRTAVSVRPRLTRYCVAISRKLGGDRTKKQVGVRQETSERTRWNDWIAKAQEHAPHVAVELWDEAKVEELLSEPENEGLQAYWFSRSVFTLEHLKNQFESQRGGWLHERYVPAVHAASELERDLALRLGEPMARAKILGWVRDVKNALEAARDAVARLDRYSAFVEHVPEAKALQKDALEGLRAATEAAKTLEQGLHLGERCLGAIPLQPDHERSVRLLYRTLAEAEDRRAFHSVDEIRERLADCFTGIYPAWARLVECWELFWRNPTTKLAAYTGRPGVGKTHGLARMVEARLASGLPAALLRAKDCRVQDGLPAIFQRAFDSPQMRLVEILNTLEATAARADIRRLRTPLREELPEGVENERTCFLLAIDGLEESGTPSQWADRLGELASHMERYPRLRVAVSLRTSARDAIFKLTRASAYDEVVLPEDGEVPSLLPIYCKHYGIPLPERRLRWAIREPLSLRLYCDIYRDGSGGVPSRKSVALPNLFEKKLERAERATCEACGISLDERPLQRLLGAIARRYVDAGALRREDAIRTAHDATEGRISQEQWGQVLERAKTEGLLLTRTEATTSLLEPGATYVEPANEPLVDYLLASAAKHDIQKALPSGGAAEVLRRLSSRPDAIAQAAVLLAGEGIDLLRSDLWPTDGSPGQVETWVLRSIASMDGADAVRYREWVRERLVASMPSCRRVLSELCVPVARDETHPLGPRFVHEALLPFLPAKRDLFWSGPPDVRGEGEPWAGSGVEALEHLKLEVDDAAEGPPLLLGWALTSVDNQWRRRLRAELARWGAGRLDELIRWLNRVFETNDPQMAEDAAMVAFGAACLAGTNPRLAELAEWVDANLLAPDAPRRREDIVVLHAARGVVERANVMGVPVRGDMLERARKLYSTGEELLPMDAGAAREADDHWGISPITGDLAWYVVPEAIQPFFSWLNGSGETLDPRAERILIAHAKREGLDSLSPQKFAFGVVAAHLHAMGWNDALADMSRAIAAQYKQETHGSRSPISAVVEKHVWTGCHALQAYLAGRAPIHDYADAGMRELVGPPVDPVLVARLPPNPVSEISLVEPSTSDRWAFWPSDGLAPQLDLLATDQRMRAIEWVQRAPEPDLRPWLILPGAAVPERANDSQWVTLCCFVKARDGNSQGESILRVSSASVAERDARRLRSSGAFRSASRSGTAGPGLVKDLSESGESIKCRTYMDPSEAVWAPWARGLYGMERIDVEDGPDSSSTIELRAANAELTWEAEGGESTCWLPAHWLRSALGLVDVERRGASGREWHFKDRDGNVHAIHARRIGNEGLSEALVIRRSSLEKALAGTGRTIVWPIWLFREPNPSLFRDENGRDPLWARRHSVFLAFMSEQGVDVVPLPGSPNVEIDEDESSPPTPPKQAEPSSELSSSVVQIGPTNPDLAVPLSSELDDDDAIPYFLWDDPMTVAEFRRRLRDASSPESERLLGLLLREARDPDIWRFTTPKEVDARFDSIAKHLGRRKAFWVFLLNAWRKEGLLGQKSA